MPDRLRVQGSRYAALVVVISILALGSCGSGSAHPKATVVINDAHPAYRGVSLGATHAHLIATLGKAPVDTTSNNVSLEPFRANDPTDQLGLPFTGPSPPPRPRLPLNKPRTDIRIVAYRNAVFEVSSTHAGVYYFGVTTPGARTSRGVGIGDSLARARATYGHVLHCASAPQSDYYESFPYCGAHLAPHLYMYFGQDPIRSIAFASTWLP